MLVYQLVDFFVIRAKQAKDSWKFSTVIGGPRVEEVDYLMYKLVCNLFYVLVY